MFTLAGIPVFVSPWYLLLLLYLSRGGLREGIIWACLITLSLLVHEFGHGMVARHFKLGPQIMLRGLGGVCSHERARRPRDNALIVAAGPGAGLMLALIAWTALAAVPSPADAGTSLGLAGVLQQLVWINLVWSLFNLAPVWPLDGGQLFQLGVNRFFEVKRAAQITHGTAIILLLLVGALLSAAMGPFALLLAGFLIWENVQQLQSGQLNVATQRNRQVMALLAQAERDYAEGNHRGALRACHQLRAVSDLPEQVLDRVWTVLGVCTTRRATEVEVEAEVEAEAAAPGARDGASAQAEATPSPGARQKDKATRLYEEALGYLKRVRDNPEAIEAQAQCLYMLDRQSELRDLTRSRTFAQLNAETRESILEVLGPEPEGQKA